MRTLLQQLALAATLTLATLLVVTRTVGEMQSVIWLPSGVAVAGVWLLGLPAVVTIVLVTLANRLAIGYAPDAAFAAGLGSACEGAFGWWLMGRMGLRGGFARLRDALALLATAAIAPLASILLSWVIRYVLDRWTEVGPFYSGWSSWWGMNALGILTVVPLALAWRSGNAAERTANGPWVLAALTGGAAVLLWLIAQFVPPSPTAIVLLSTLLPIPLFGALRLGPPGAIVPSAASAVMLTSITAAAAGPFLCVPLVDRHAPLQIFLVVILAVPLVIGALIAEREAFDAERRRFEDQLRQAQKMDAIGKLAGGVAHDFNNLLMATIGYAEALRQDLPANDRRRADVDGILQSSERAAGLVQQLLAFSRKQNLKPEVVDLALVVETLAPILRRLVGERIRIVTRTTDGPHCVRVDRVQMEQVLLNLVVNARDALPDGGTVTVETTNVRVPATGSGHAEHAPPGDHVVLSVRDDGTGMSADVRARAFEPFFSTKGEMGTGLGLSTVLGIVEQSGGTLQLDSEPRAGTTVRVCLPRVAPTRPQATKPPVLIPQPPPKPPAAPAATTVLLAEDEAMVRELVVRLLRRAGHTVLAADGGRQALELAEGHRGEIHLLITDMVMPDMSGRELARSVLAARPDLPVLFMSGYAQDLHDIAAPGRADRRFLQKPFLADQLRDAVNELLRVDESSPAPR